MDGETDTKASDEIKEIIDDLQEELETVVAEENHDEVIEKLDDVIDATSINMSEIYQLKNEVVLWLEQLSNQMIQLAELIHNQLMAQPQLMEKMTEALEVLAAANAQNSSPSKPEPEPKEENPESQEPPTVVEQLEAEIIPAPPKNRWRR